MRAAGGLPYTVNRQQRAPAGEMVVLTKMKYGNSNQQALMARNQQTAK